jgi:hypothetical protein
MTGYPNDSRGDVQAWHLTPAQASRYHQRLSRYHADRSVRLAKLARRYADQAEKAATVAAVASCISLALQLIAWAGRHL